MHRRRAAVALVTVAFGVSMSPEAQAAVPDPPAVSSAEYPDDADWHDGVGRYGNFVIDDPGDVAVRYEIRFNAEPLITADTTAGAAVTVRYLPTRSGPNRVTVQSVAADSARSAPTTYFFSVSSGTAAKAWWRLDEPAGAATLRAVTRENEPEIVAQPQGGVTLGAEAQVGTAMSLDGSTGHAATAGPVSDTTQSYSVSAWVRPASAADATVASQAGAGGTGFALSAAGGHWVFGKSLSDHAAAKAARVVSDLRLQVGEWTHLVGVYDATVNKLGLYVNGEPAGERSLTAAPWSAQGPFRIGAGSSGGDPVDFLPGAIDEVRVFDRIIVADEVTGLFRLPPVRRARWKLNVDGADDTGLGHDLALRGGATIDPDSGFFWMSPAGLLLNGTDGYAETATPVVRTDVSFSLTAWAFTTSRPAERATVFSAAGANANRFVVRYQPGEDPATQGRWQLEMADEDTATARISSVTHSNYTEGSWDHLALVYDAYHDTMTLYVNGQPEINEQNSSIKGGVLGFAAGNGGVQVGRSKLGNPEYWPGAIDDVWAFQGVLGQEQIQSLAALRELDTEHGPGVPG